jgi:hypothetical protein
MTDSLTCVVSRTFCIKDTKVGEATNCRAVKADVSLDEWYGDEVGEERENHK